MEDILVSIIIPVYNTEKYISECMESVINQTYRNIEIILINDGSTDKSADVCRRYTSDDRVIFIDRENRGLSQTRKQGIAISKGEYFCNLDSDDCLELSFVEKMLHKAREKNADIVTCARKDFSDSYEKDISLNSGRDVYALTEKEVSENIYTLHCELWLSDSWNKMYKSSFVKLSGVEYCLSNKYNGTDYLFNHLLVLHNPKYAVLNEPLLLHRIVLGSRVHRKNKPLQDGFQTIIELVFEEAKKLNYPVCIFENYSYCYSSMLDMAYQAILDECETAAEASGRLKEFLKKRKQFESKHKMLSAKKINTPMSTISQRLYYMSMSGNSLLICKWAFLLMKWKRRKKADE